MNKQIFSLVMVCFMFTCCMNSSEKPVNKTPASKETSTGKATATAAPASAGDSVKYNGHNPVPILCYHQIRDWTDKDSKNAKVYIVPVKNFKDQIKLLHDSGYHAILPDQLMAYLEHGKALPSKPVMITFDDGDLTQYTDALPELDKAGYKATFFIMTVSLNRPRYVTNAQVKELFDKGHTIGCHTWDHHMVTKYTEADWVKQIEKPNATLNKITGTQVKYFAYPFGLWNEPAVEHLKKYGFTAAFKLAGKNSVDPKYTIARQIIDGAWSAEHMLKMISRKG